MELFEFFRGLLAWMATVAVLLPISIPAAALAYKARFGHKPIDIEPGEYWWRASWAAIVLALVAVGFVLLDWFVADNLDFPPGMVHMIAVMAYLPTGVWIMTFFFGYSDLFDGLSAFTLYTFLPVLTLYAINAIFKWNLTKVASDWLKPVTA